MEKIQALMEEVGTGLRKGRTEEEIFQSLLRVFGANPETDGKTLPSSSGAWRMRK